jgi:hypothetical protein
VLRFVCDRREWLRVGGLAGLGLLAGVRGANAASPSPGFAKAKSVLLVFTSGGQSQLDTWDPKPDAPEDVRGAFRPIATSVAGTAVCEHMPRLARLAHVYTILRSVSHDDTDHGSACYLALTGRFHERKSSNPLPKPTDHPTMGAALRRVRPPGRLPYAAVHVNGPVLAPLVPAPGQDAGLLGRGCDPLTLGDVTTEAAALDLDAPPEMTAERLDGRRALLEALEGGRRDVAGREMNALYGQAYDLLAAPRFRRAFDLGQEPESVRDRYGRSRSGQACLLARRLVEAEVPFVAVMWNHSIRGQDQKPEETDAYGWDTHNDIFASLSDHLLPRFDVSFSALLEDLAQRGLLETTLVVCMGEFGRAPRVAKEPTFAGEAPGRKHWAAVYSVVLAGAGVARGGLYGASDRHGAYPAARPVGPWDVTATMFAALGIDPAGQFTDPAGQPHALTTGAPITGLYG